MKVILKDVIEITKDQAKELKEGVEYIVFNPLTQNYKREKASKKDIVHNKYAYKKLKFYIDRGN